MKNRYVFVGLLIIVCLMLMAATSTKSPTRRFEYASLMVDDLSAFPLITDVIWETSSVRETERTSGQMVEKLSDGKITFDQNNINVLLTLLGAKGWEMISMDRYGDIVLYMFKKQL